MTLFRQKTASWLPRAFGVLFGLSAFAAAHGAGAATAYFAPSSGVRASGATFTVNVNVSSPDQAINAADLVIGFPADRLQVTSVSKGSSIISFWVEEPSFSNADGTVRFQGVIPNPGWKGSAGRLVSITFRAKGEGTAALRFISGSLLANDGLGTNVLTGFGSASFSIVAAGQETPVVEGGEPPAAPAITAEAFPDQNAWYRPADLAFAWKRVEGVNGASWILDSSSSTSPDAVSEGNVSSATIKNPGDGIWHFHLRVRNALGWSGTSHYRVKLDGTPPEDITLKEVPDADGIILYRFGARDAGSGVALFRVSIDGGEPFDWHPSEDRFYEPPPLLPGKHVIRLEAIDGTGNAAAADFTIEQATLRPPSGIAYPKKLDEGARFDISGQWAPDARVALRLIGDDGASNVFSESTDADGRFSFAFSEGLAAGTYTFTLWASDAEGRTSAETDPRVILVLSSDGRPAGTAAENRLMRLSPLLIVLAFALILCVASLAMLIMRRNFQRVLAKYKEAIRKSFDKAENESEGHEHPALHRAKKIVDQAIRDLEDLSK